MIFLAVICGITRKILSGITGKVVISVSQISVIKMVYATGQGRTGKQPLPNSIDTLTETGKKCGPMYNVLGQRISAPKKGELYIQNGEKRVKK